MGAVNSIDFTKFSNDIMAKIGSEFQECASKNSEGLKSIFDAAAKNDDGKDDTLYEYYNKNDYTNLVQKGIDFVKQQFAKGVVGNIKQKFDNIKLSNKIKQLEKDMSDKTETSGLAKNTVEYFGGSVPDWGVTWFCNKGGDLFDLLQAIDEYAMNNK